MKRRNFLLYSTLGGLALSTSGLLTYVMAGRHGGHGQTSLLSPSALPDGQPLQPLPRITNLSDRSGMFRSALTVAPSEVALDEDRQALLWLYNHKVAPLIEVREGDELDITLINELEVDTTVHWHGVRIQHQHDGTPWDAVAPGESHQYRHRFAEGSAGLHWFHPHPHEGTARQVAHGLAGALLVRPAQDVLSPELDEHLLLVSDLRLTADGRVAPHTAADWMNGREGELLLVNGQRQPYLDVAPGTTLRLRLINACAGRYLRLRLEGHELTLIGTDGGLIEQPQALDELLLTPGERADLLVRISDQPGGGFQLASHPYDRGWMGPEPAHLSEVLPLLDIRTQQADAKPAVTLPASLATIDRLGEPSVRRQVELTEVMPGMDHGDDGGTMDHGDHGAMNGNDAPGGHGAQGESAGHGDYGGGHGAQNDRGDHGSGDHGSGGHGSDGHDGMASDAAPQVDFLINGRAFAMDEVLFEGRAGEIEEWEVFNNSHMDHPFHVHGTHFQVIASRPDDGEWQDSPWLAWKDTVNLAPYQRLRLRMVFREPGDWLFHCHIIEHEELGMMATVRIR